MFKKTIKTKIGYEISLTEFRTVMSPSGIVIISPATGVKQHYYFKFAEFLKSEGYTTYSFDFSGIGESKNESLKIFDTSALNWGYNDLESVIQFCKKKHPDKSLTIVGHSIGGQLIGLAPSAKYIDKIILIASQSGYWKFWKGIEKYKMFLNWYLLFPLLTRIYGYFPGKHLNAMEDLPGGMSLEWRKWCVSPNYLFDHISKDDLYYDQINCELYSYSADDDKYAPKESVDWLTAKYSCATIKRNHLIPEEINVSKIGHFGFFKERMKETIWKRVLENIKPTDTV